MGTGFYAFLNATLIPGGSFMMDCIHLREKIQGASLVITGEGQIDSQTIYGKTPIAVAKLAKEFKIPVCITPGILTDATADLTFALILSITRRIVESDQFTRKGLFKGWGPNLFLGMELSGKTLGIVGMGRIGQALATRAKAFNMNIVYHSRTEKNIAGAKLLPLNELLKTSDVVSLHTPLTTETHHLIGEAQLNMIKKSAFLINTTRGAVVDEKALYESLKSKRIAGAGLDVYEEEPLLYPGLVELDNTVLLPHIGSATVETRTQMALLAAENAIAIIQGKKPHAIANPLALS
jgi:glyoxylate reductase